MKKTLIALAIASISASAFASGTHQSPVVTPTAVTVSSSAVSQSSSAAAVSGTGFAIEGAANYTSSFTRGSSAGASIPFGGAATAGTDAGTVSISAAGGIVGGNGAGGAASYGIANANATATGSLGHDKFVSSVSNGYADSFVVVTGTGAGIEGSGTLTGGEALGGRILNSTATTAITGTISGAAGFTAGHAVGGASSFGGTKAISGIPAL